MRKRPIPDCMIPFIDNMRKINFIDDGKPSIVFSGGINFINLLEDTTTPDLPEDAYLVKLIFGDDDNPTSITPELESLNPYIELYENDTHLGNLTLHYEFYEEEDMPILATEWYPNYVPEGTWLEADADTIIIHIGSYTKTFEK